jgi:hypothetical protein
MNVNMCGHLRSCERGDCHLVNWDSNRALALTALATTGNAELRGLRSAVNLVAWIPVQLR